MRKKCFRRSVRIENRYYASAIGRFTTPDPHKASAGLQNPQSWNRYAYVENDPINFNDPSGLRLQGIQPDWFGGGSGWFSIDWVYGLEGEHLYGIINLPPTQNPTLAPPPLQPVASDTTSQEGGSFGKLISS